MISRRSLMMALLPVCVLIGCAAGYAAERAGVVVGVQGRAEAVPASGGARDLAMGSEVFAGDTLQTDKGAKLQVMLEDDSLISLGENSSVTLDEYLFNPNEKANNALMIRIQRGIARVITGIITDLNPNRFTVRTSRATIGIRGCELGFRCLDDEHRYYVVRVPEGRSIHVASELTKDVVVFTSPGFVDVDAMGRLRKGFLQEQDVHDLQEQTTPQFARKPSQRAADSSAEEHAADHSAMETVAESLPMAQETLPDSAAGGTLSERMSPAATVSSAPEDIRMDSVVSDNRQEQVPLPARPPPAPQPPAPPPPPEPVYPRVKGGGASARYVPGTAWADLTSVTRFYRADGFIGEGVTSVDFWGERYDALGNAMGSVALSLRDVRLIAFGGRTLHEGWREIAPVPGVRLANDNLQQFVRHIDLRGSAPQMLYWGIPSSEFAEPGMPPNRMLVYDVAYTEYEVQKPAPFNVDTELSFGKLRYNTKTDAYAILIPGMIPIYGRGGELQFFGQFQQGVGGSWVRQSADPVRPDGSAGMVFAGFRDVLQERPAMSGVVSWRGYAAAMAWDDAASPAVYQLHSADMTSDNPDVNEARVTMTINRDDPLDPITPHIMVSQMPPLSAPTDIVLDNSYQSLFVDKDLYFAATFENNTHSTLSGVGGGQNWSWGIWDSDRTIDMGGGATRTERARGHYVVGETLSPAAFQALVMGAQSYVLQTPAGMPGHVSATLTALPDYHVFLEGEARLTVNIPGSGATPTWNGQFTGGTSDGDRFVIQYNASRPISPNGHLRGGMPDMYMLNARGIQYGGGSLMGAQMTGNLVGPGVGPSPIITGAIGEGRFEHSDGTVLNLTYGTDLAP